MAIVSGAIWASWVVLRVSES
ncbi:hypothetical protein AZE42_14047, partial [Rhizopogon vesiculosus]